MGRQNREKKARILQGEEKSIAQKKQEEREREEEEAALKPMSPEELLAMKRRLGWIK